MNGTEKQHGNHSKHTIAKQTKLNNGGNNGPYRRHEDKECNWVGNKAPGTEENSSQMFYATKQL